MPTANLSERRLLHDADRKIDHPHLRDRRFVLVAAFDNGEETPELRLLAEKNDVYSLLDALAEQLVDDPLRLAAAIQEVNGPVRTILDDLHSPTLRNLAYQLLVGLPFDFHGEEWNMADDSLLGRVPNEYPGARLVCAWVGSPPYSEEAYAILALT